MCQAMEITVADLQHMSKKSEIIKEEGLVASVRTRKGFRSKENYAYKEGDRADNSIAGQQGTKWHERKSEGLLEMWNITSTPAMPSIW